MKIIDCIKIAFLNIMCKKRKALSLCGNLLVVLTLISLWMAATYSFLQVHKDILYGKASMCCFVTSVDKDEKTMENDLLNQETMSKARISEPELVSYVGMEEKWVFVNIKRVEIDVEGKRYVGENDFSYDFENEKLSDGKSSVKYKLGISMEDEFFAENQIKEYEYENENTYEGAIICGSPIMKEGQFLITDYYLDKFGIKPEEYNSLIGKKISMSSNGRDFFKDFILAGIVDSRVYYTDALYGMPQVIIRGNNEILERFQCNTIYEIYSLKDYNGLVKVYSELNEEGWYLATSGIEEAVKCSVIEDSSMLIRKIISVFGGLLIMAFIMNIAQIIWNDLKNKESYMGISIVNGMNAQNVMLIEYIQLSILVFIANIFAQIVAVVLYNSLSRFMYEYIGVEMKLEMGIFVLILLITSVLTTCVIFAIEIPVLHKMVKKQPCQLLCTVTK